MRRSLITLSLAAAFLLGAASLWSASNASAARPCPDFGIPCLDYYDPVRCFKPGEGWKTYSNECYAHRDCAIRCRSLGI
jgi:hypothetical protein